MSQAYTTLDDCKAFSSAFEKFANMVATLHDAPAHHFDHGQVERFLETSGRELLRRMFQGYLDHRAATEPDWGSLEGHDAIIRNHRRQDCQRHLVTLFGEVIVSRTSNGARGVESGFALDAQLNLPPDKYSDGLRRRLANDVALMSFDEATAQVDQTTGGHIPKRQSEQVVVKVAQDFEAFYDMRRADEPEASEDLLILTTDAKGIVMRQEDLREATRRAAQRAKSAGCSGLSPGKKDNRKRMAQVASVYSVAPYVRRPEAIMNPPPDQDAPLRPKVENKRVWASVERDTQQVIDDIFDEAFRRDPQKQRQWVVLIDGDRDQLACIQATAARHQVTVTIIIDFIHVLEYLWEAARALNSGDTQSTHGWVQTQALKVLQGQGQAVARGRRLSATLGGLSDSKREAVDTCADYLRHRWSFLQYDLFLEQGFPIATGVIEGACRHLVKDRMDLTGARWRLQSAEAVLKLRSLRSSRDFEEYWRFHKQQELERHHLSRYAECLFLEGVGVEN
jgi:hypothetical protein